MPRKRKYKPTGFMAKGSKYSEEAANHAVSFINNLCHTKGQWYGVPFDLIDWQEQIVRDLFGILKPNGYRQFNTAYIEIPKKQGKSELAAAIALLLTCGDFEHGGEVYGCASDRQQASIVFDVAVHMVEQCPALKKRIKPVLSQKRLIYTPLDSFYQVLSAEAYCMLPDTMIDLEDGSRKRADDVSPGDMVLGCDDNNNLVFGRVRSVEKQTPSPIYRINTCRGREVSVTANHRFLVMASDARHCHWVKARDLCEGDQLKIALGWPETSHNHHEQEKAWVSTLAALFDADGYISPQSNMVRWMNSRHALLEKCQSLLARLGINSSLNDGELFVFGKAQLRMLQEHIYPHMTNLRKRKMLLEKAGGRRMEQRQEDIFDRVTRIEIFPPAETISLEVEGIHTHATNGILTHNTKHGLNVHGVVFDELHAQPNRQLYDVMMHGSGDARTQPLYFLITTAGNDRNSICWEVHQKAVDILDGRKVDPSFYPIVYGAPDEADWTSEKVWRAANPSLGITVDIEKLRIACDNARSNPAEENLFRQLRLNQWVKQAVRWMPMEIWDSCGFAVDADSLRGRTCYGGLDLSSTTDITAFVLVFPPLDEYGKYEILPHFWIPEDNLALRVRRDHVPYDIWQQEGFLYTTEGNVVHYGFIENFIDELGAKYNIREIAFDRWGAVQMTQNLDGMGFTVVPFGQGFKDMSPPTKEFMKLAMEQKLAHGGHPVLRWMVDNIFVRTDPAGNIKPDKEKSTEKIDGAVATIMALDRAIRHGGGGGTSVYENRGLLIL